MSATYLIRIKDQTGAKVTEFAGRGRSIALPGGLQNFSYYKRLRTSGGFTIVVDGLDERIGYLDLDEVGTLDSQVEFWRRDLDGGMRYTNWLAGLPAYQTDPFLPGWYRDFEGLHRAMAFDQDQEGRDVFTAYGRGYNDLLSTETIRYDVGSIYATKSTVAETAIKEFVDENIGPGATAPPRPRDGVKTGLTIEADAATGAVWTGDRGNENLMDVCAELAEYGPGDYMIVGTGAATFQFQWRYPRWGLDKRIGNADGNPPVVFSAQYGTATNITYRYSRLDEANICDVIGVGRGENADQRTLTVMTGGEVDSPLNARSVARTTRSNYDNATLTDMGWKTLDRQQVKRMFSFDARQMPGCRYSVDWDFGDLVTVVYRGREIGQKVVGVRVNIDGGGDENIQPETEDIPT
jgi:hypothetical protein